MHTFVRPMGLVFLVVCSLPAFAQVPESIAYQGYLEQSGVPVDGTVSMTVRLFEAATGGTAVFSRTYPSVAVSEGVYEIALAGGSPPLRLVAFGQPLWLEVEVGGSLLAPRTALAAAPYALGLRGLRVQDTLIGNNYSLIGGSSTNAIDPSAANSVISGGRDNTITGFQPRETVIAGGTGNTANAIGSAIGGGTTNYIPSGAQFATIPGGQANAARRTFSVAMGAGARANHTGSFVFAGRGLTTDPSVDTTYTTANFQFIVRAAGGAGFGTYRPLAQMHVAGSDLSMPSSAAPNDVLVVEDTDATLSLYSSESGSIGSLISLAEIDAGSFVDKWGIVRETTNGSGDSKLRFTYGMNANAATNAIITTMTPNGAVGMGTTDPIARLHLQSNDLSTPSAAAFNDVLVIERNDAIAGFYSNDGGAVGSGLTLGEVDGGALVDKWGIIRQTSTAGSDLLFSYGTNANQSANDVQVRFTDTGSINIDGAYLSSGADYAELLPLLDPTERLEAGTVVGVFAGAVSLETAGADRVLVVSEQPAVLGNAPMDGSHGGYVPVGFVGQVPVRVTGDVAPGDFLVASGRADGLAHAVAPKNLTLADVDLLVGRAWKTSDGLGRAIAAIGLSDRADALRVIAERQQERLEQQERRLERLERMLGLETM
ncbi:MAG: hypothetical protein AAF752_13650 [Bacteroidota bacterium]